MSCTVISRDINTCNWSNYCNYYQVQELVMHPFWVISCAISSRNCKSSINRKCVGSEIKRLSQHYQPPEENKALPEHFSWRTLPILGKGSMGVKSESFKCGCQSWGWGQKLVVSFVWREEAKGYCLPSHPEWTSVNSYVFEKITKFWLTIYNGSYSSEKFYLQP